MAITQENKTALMLTLLAGSILALAALTGCGDTYKVTEEVGVPGEQGPQGQQGLTGPAGPKGDDGESVEITREEYSFIDGGSCGGEVKSELLPNHYFETSGGFVLLRLRSDNSLVGKYNINTFKIHEDKVYQQSTKSAFGLVITKVDLVIARASGCGYIVITSEAVSEGL